MVEYLKQDLMKLVGYAVTPGRPKPGEAAVALTKDGQVVFGDPATTRGTYAKKGSVLMYYDDEVERQRRLLCDTALGQLILDHPKFAQPAVNLVSRGIEAYWRGLSGRLGSPDAFEKIVKGDGKYVSNPTSFGRLPVAVPGQGEVNKFKATIEIWLSALDGADLPKIMTLHDTFLKIYCSNEPGMKSPMDEAGNRGFREDWYNLEARGRANRQGFKQSSLPGLITPDFTIPVWEPLDRCGIDFLSMRSETRNRGTDMFMIAARVMQPAFKQVLGQNNLVFAASASGTTSTLLTAADIFSRGAIRDHETMREYLMGCLAYLVGGGMHTSHEVFYTGGVAGLSYTPGKYTGMLSSAFTGSKYYGKWATEFWEFVRPDRGRPR